MKGLIFRWAVRRLVKKGTAKVTRQLVRGILYPAGTALLTKVISNKTSPPSIESSFSASDRIISKDLSEATNHTPPQSSQDNQTAP
ncbi:hypothetical protein Slip_0335 [Syntrophothermus lipocalidus DSM 12680]|uniref:Uncharacterized protein n=1 Tax=Syntrophothermus lipocalidus (strain DSM 12680 / TGB-C1) TaxID=643648 RepID=D7CK05_SYNLT|nr:hypothetical protein Slip_0335 [Syntrophothermus lipocalidus DSM 12680]